MSFMLYLIGYILMIAGLAYGAMLLRVPQTWIIIGVVVMIGLGILTGVKNTRQKDPAV